MYRVSEASTLLVEGACMAFRDAYKAAAVVAGSKGWHWRDVNCLIRGSSIWNRMLLYPPLMYRLYHSCKVLLLAEY